MELKAVQKEEIKQSVFLPKEKVFDIYGELYKGNRRNPDPVMRIIA